MNNSSTYSQYFPHLTPSLTATQIAFGDGSNLMTSNSGLLYDGTNFSVGSGVNNFFVGPDNQVLIQPMNDGDNSSTITAAEFASSISVIDAGSIKALLTINGAGTPSAFFDNDAHAINVGINTSTPSVALDVVGDVLLTTTNAVVAGAVQFSSYGAGALTTDGSGNITAVSDRRVKHNIQPFIMGSKELLKLSPSTFIYNKDSTNTVMPGFIAQDVEKAFNGVGIGHDKAGMLSLNTNVVLAALVNGFKEQQKEIEILKSQNKQLLKQLGSTGK